MPDDARLWIYVADRNLSAADVDVVASHMSPFIASWVAHGNPLRAAWALYFKRVLILAVDSQSSAASGCSIDASTASLRLLGDTLGLNWFSRTSVLHWDQDTSAFAVTPMNTFWAMRKAGIVHDGTQVVNSFPNTRAEWLSQGIQPFRESWHQSMW
jgi:hypothetical protein